MCKKVLIALIVWLVILPSENKAQDIGALLREAQQLESAFRDQEALRKYSDVLRHQPNNLRILCKVSELHALLGRQLNPKEKQNEYLAGLNKSKCEIYIIAFVHDKIYFIKYG